MTLPTGPVVPDALIDAAKVRLRHMKKWWPRLWAFHHSLTAVSVILTAMVPFGLGLLLYIPTVQARTLNIALIVLSAIGFVAQVWNVTQRNRDRAQHLRVVAADLEAALVLYQSGDCTREELAQAVRHAFARDAQEPAA